MLRLVCRTAPVAILILTLIIFAGPAQAARCKQNQDKLGLMIGQMLMFGFYGTKPGHKGPQAIARHLCNGTIGGVFMLGHNVKGSDQVKALTALYRGAGARTTPFIAIDHEGGMVQRLGRKLGYQSIPRPSTVAAKYSTKQARQLYRKAAAQVRGAGFNLNFAPVVDVNVNPKNPAIGKLGRSFSAKPQTVIDYARAFIAAHHSKGVLTVLKHFPGHGSSQSDSHDGFVDISSSWKKNTELSPFKALGNDQDYGDMIMVGHLYHSGLSPKGQVPATISYQAITGLLRGQLGYQGVVITDDLEMAAIRKNFGFRNAVIRAINAGNDILMISNSAKPDLKLADKVVAMIKKAISKGQIKRARIEQSYNRIRNLKQKLERLE